MPCDRTLCVAAGLSSVRAVLNGCSPAPQQDLLDGTTEQNAQKERRQLILEREQALLDGGIWSFQPSADGGRLISVSPFGGAFDVSPTSQPTTQRRRWPRAPAGMGGLDASPANVANAWYAFSPVADLEDLYRSGFDDCERFLQQECPGRVLAPYTPYSENR